MQFFRITLFILFLVLTSCSKEKNIEVYGKIEKDVDKSNVAKRLANYYDDLSGVQQFVNSYLKYMYWGAIIITIAVFIFKRQFTNIKSYPFIIFFIIFPK